MRQLSRPPTRVNTANTRDSHVNASETPSLSSGSSIIKRFQTHLSSSPFPTENCRNGRPILVSVDVNTRDNRCTPWLGSISLTWAARQTITWIRYEHLYRVPGTSDGSESSDITGAYTNCSELPWWSQSCERLPSLLFVDIDLIGPLRTSMPVAYLMLFWCIICKFNYFYCIITVLISLQDAICCCGAYSRLQFQRSLPSSPRAYSLHPLRLHQLHQIFRAMSALCVSSPWTIEQGGWGTRGNRQRDCRSAEGIEDY